MAPHPDKEAGKTTRRSVRESARSARTRTTPSVTANYSGALGARQPKEYLILWIGWGVTLNPQDIGRKVAGERQRPDGYGFRPRIKPFPMSNDPNEGFLSDVLCKRCIANHPDREPEQSVLVAAGKVKAGSVTTKRHAREQYLPGNVVRASGPTCVLH